MHTYADDTQLYLSFSDDSRVEQSAALSAMQNCIADIRQWMLQDRLRLNDDKTEFIIIGTRQQLAKVNIDSLRVGESSTAPTSKVKSLGCWFDGQLKMDTQINSICKTAFFHLYNIRRIKKFLNFECTKILVNAFVTSRLDFCNSLPVWIAQEPAIQTKESPKCGRSPNPQCRWFRTYHSITVHAALATR